MDAKYNVVPDKQYKARLWNFIGSLVSYCFILAISIVIVALGNKRGNPTSLKVFYWFSIFINIAQIAVLILKYVFVGKGIYNKVLIMSEYILAGAWELVIILQFIIGCVAFGAFRTDLLLLCGMQAVAIFFLLFISRKVSLFVDKTTRLPSVGNFDYKYSFSDEDKKSLQNSLDRRERRKAILYIIVCAIICTIEGVSLGISKLPPQIDYIFAQDRLLGYEYYENVEGYEDGYYVSKVYYGVNDSIVVPLTYNNKPVVGILSNALNDSGNITSVQIGEYDENGNLNSNVKVIEKNAISLNNIDSLIIPSSVETIGKDAISGEKIKTIDYYSDKDFSMESIKAPSLKKLILESEETAIKVDYQQYNSIEVSIPLNLYNEYRHISYDNRAQLNVEDQKDNIIIDFETNSNIHLDSLILPKDKAYVNLSMLKNLGVEATSFIEDTIIYNNDKFARDGFTSNPGSVFRGWYRDSEYTMETVLTRNNTVAFARDTVLYANWCEVKTVELDWGNYFPYNEKVTSIDFVNAANDGEVVSFPKLKKFGGNITRAGFDNLTWYYGDTAVEKTSDLLNVSEKTIVLTPKWNLTAPTINESTTQVGSQVYPGSGLTFTFDESQSILFKSTASHACKETGVSLQYNLEKINDSGDSAIVDTHTVNNASSYTLNHTFRNYNQSGNYLLKVIVTAPTGERAIASKNYAITINKKALTFDSMTEELPQRVVTYNGSNVLYSYPHTLPADIKVVSKYDVNHNNVFVSQSPYHAGLYNVEFVFSKVGVEADNYTTITLPSTLLINQKQVDVDWKTITYEYDATEHSITPSVVGGAPSDTNLAFIYDNNRQKNVGTYTTSITGINNSDYTFKDGIQLSQDWTITKKNLSISWNSATTKTFNGETQIYDFTISGLARTDVQNANNSLQLNTSSLVFTTEQKPNDGALKVKVEAKNVGDYNIQILGFNDNNYEASTILLTSREVKINPAVINAQWSNKTLTYNGASQAMELALTGFFNDDAKQYTRNNITQKMTYVSDGSIGLIDNNDRKVTIGFSSIDAGEYTTTINSIVSNYNNYVLNSENMTSTLKINKASYTLEWGTKEFTYNGLEQALQLTISNVYQRDINNITTFVGSHPKCTSTTISNSTNGRVISFKGISADSYNVSINSIGNEQFRNNYEDKECSTTFNIKPRLLKLEWRLSDTNDNLVYNGLNHSVVASVTNRCGSDEIPLAYNNETAIDAGSYTATITTTNTNYKVDDTCNYNWEITKKSITVSKYNGPATIYDGQYHEFGFRYDGFVNTPLRDDLNSVDNSCFTYNRNPESKVTMVNGVVIDNGCIVVKFKAIDANTYTIAQGTHTFSNYTIQNLTYSFAINQKAITNSWVNGDTLEAYTDNDFVYDKNYHSVKPVFTGLCVREDSGEEDSLTPTISDMANYRFNAAGTYIATITNLNNSNYAINDSTKVFNWVINKRVVGVTWSNNKFTYDGSNKNDTASFSNVCSGDSVSGSYAVYKNGIVVDTYREAGNYSIRLVSLSNSNYCLPEDNLTKAYTINKRVLTFALERASSSDYVYSGADIDCIKLTVSGFTDSTYARNFRTGDLSISKPQGGTFEYRTYGPYSSIFYLKARNAGTYSLIVNSVTNSNYDFDGNSHLEVEIYPKVLEWTWPATNYTYNGTIHSFEINYANIGADAVNVNYSCSGSAYIDGSTISSPKAKNAGVYTISVESIADNSNYTLVGTTSALSKVFTINRAEINLEKESSNDTVTYNGECLTGLSLKVKGYLPADSNLFTTLPIIYTNTGASSQDTYTNYTINNKAVDAGTYEVEILGLKDSFNSSNYELATIFVNKTYTYYVYKTKVSLDWGTIDCTYNGEEQTREAVITSKIYTNALTNSKDTVVLSYTNNKQTNAGTYSITASLSHKNYELNANTSTSWTINEKQLITSWDCGSSLVYNGALRTANLSISGLLEKDATLIDSSTFVTNVAPSDMSSHNSGTERIVTLSYSKKDVGSYSFKINSENLSNYRISDVEHIITIAPKVLSITWDTNCSFVYSGESKTLNYTVDGICEGDVLTPSISENSATVVGQYTARLSLPSNCNYALPSNYQCNWSIIAKELSAEWVDEDTEDTTNYTYTGYDIEKKLVVRGFVQGQEANVVNSFFSFNNNATITIDNSSSAGSVIIAFKNINCASYEYICYGLGAVALASNYYMPRYETSIAINRRAIEVEIGNASFNYNGAEQSFDVTIKNLSAADLNSTTKDSMFSVMRKPGSSAKYSSKIVNGNLVYTIAKTNVDKETIQILPINTVQLNYACPSISTNFEISAIALTNSWSISENIKAFDFDNQYHEISLMISGFVGADADNVEISQFALENGTISEIRKHSNYVELVFKAKDVQSNYYAYEVNSFSNTNYSYTSSGVKRIYIRPKSLTINYVGYDEYTFVNAAYNIRFEIAGFIAGDEISLSMFSSAFTLDPTQTTIENSNKLCLVFSLKDAGEYTFAIGSCLDRNYSLSSYSRTVVIHKQQLSANSVDIVGDNESHEYDGLYHSITYKVDGLNSLGLSAIQNGFNVTGAETVDVALVDDHVEFYCKCKNVADYTISLESNSNLPNYELSAVESSFSITPCVLNTEWQYDEYNEYDGTYKDITLKISGFIDTNDINDISVTSFTANNIFTLEKESNYIMLTFRAKNIGDYNFSVTGISSNKYSINTTKAIGTIYRRMQITYPEIDSVVYDGSTHTVTVQISGFVTKSHFEGVDLTNLRNGIISSGNVLNLQVLKNDSGDNNIIEVQYEAHNVGEYRISLDLYVNPYYHIAFESTFSITPKTVTLIRDSLLDSNGLVFDGVVENESIDYTIKYYSEEACENEIIDFDYATAGTYFYTITINSNKYVLAEVDRKGSFVID